jgi:hypothetical protein
VITTLFLGYLRLQLQLQNREIAVAEYLEGGKLKFTAKAKKKFGIQFELLESFLFFKEPSLF